KLIEKQLSFFWRPEEVDVSRDRIDYQALPEHEKHIFISNLKYQTLLDSIQGRSPNVALLPLISIPELETWVETWAFSDTSQVLIHGIGLERVWNGRSKPTACIRILVMYSTYWQRMSLFRPIIEPSR
ncbi:ribonucleotide-diphosphate reductase subunit beta, partial [Escherichia sp. R-CC3]